MKIAVFSTKPYDQQFLQAANTSSDHEFVFFEQRLTRDTSALAADFPGVCVFVNDQLDADVVEALAHQGTRLIALRCAGFNNVDLMAAKQHQLTVVRVPAYSPYAVAEHTLGMILALNRQLYRSYTRIREGNFALDGLLGFDVYGRTIGIIGTGQIGVNVARIMKGIGCEILAYDPMPNPACDEFGVRYVALTELLSRSDIVTLHCPLMPETYHIINAETIQLMKPGVMLINTSRGALLDTSDVIVALKDGHIGYLGLDVYEEEQDLFFENLSNKVLQDDVFARLLTFPNVLITGHQAFFTREALERIASTTVANITSFEQGEALPNKVSTKHLAK
ncbi:MAG: 2-hydroxyacid dehydrogenase [Chloroflexi bacterium AL-W]|nr:2-hydroxyacid dehydrogenase [Chloroflexi bacterium AL-N1]NOK68810.1 2-hydroxyacid dehydrogenase [Chloroflexi bacterium AL-N10]NOK76296.1 2-hydroxyacid dehydrogenase [Chloroflexi bacterium AL-N5]NOK84067.1 2-hydroxyacid dehydrogenase [Chloroflexi bacterium AL-W]NOK91434.1 2-hydroxyacid dehydrogenase [Chloroflexi bacterium AL-N15]